MNKWFFRAYKPKLFPNDESANMVRIVVKSVIV